MGRLPAIAARLCAGLVLGLAVAGAAGAELIRPAELPPPDYRGQQYVDSKGCLFMRAGQPGQELWVPRVTREGVPLCGNPPSGRRVPVAEDGVSVAPPETAPDQPQPAPVATAGGYYVAVGSFSVAANVEKALARLQALNYPAARGQHKGKSGPVTVFAGPFGSAEEAAQARRTLRGAGFPDAIVVGP